MLTGQEVEGPLHSQRAAEGVQRRNYPAVEVGLSRLPGVEEETVAE
jgi:hypothetical protein